MAGEYGDIIRPFQAEAPRGDVMLDALNFALQKQKMQQGEQNQGLADRTRAFLQQQNGLGDVDPTGVQTYNGEKQRQSMNDDIQARAGTEFKDAQADRVSKADYARSYLESIRGSGMDVSKDPNLNASLHSGDSATAAGQVQGLMGNDRQNDRAQSEWDRQHAVTREDKKADTENSNSTRMAELVKEYALRGEGNKNELQQKQDFTDKQGVLNGDKLEAYYSSGDKSKIPQQYLGDPNAIAQIEQTRNQRVELANKRISDEQKASDKAKFGPGIKKQAQTPADHSRAYYAGQMTPIGGAISHAGDIKDGIKAVSPIGQLVKWLSQSPNK